MDHTHTTMKNKLETYKKNLKEIFYYSDNEVLDIVMSICAIFVHPFTMNRIPDTPSFWCLFGVLGGIVLFIGVLERHLSLKYWGTKIIWLFLITLITQCTLCWCWTTDMIIYILQLIIVWYCMWRNGKQLRIYNSRKK